MNKMLNYLNGYKRECVLAPLFKMLEASFDLFVPLVMADIVNVGIAAHDFHYILMRCGILLLLAIIGLACSLTAQYFSAKASVGYSTALRHALFAHIQTLSFTEMDTLGTSTLITRMTSDLNQVQSGLNLFLRLFLRSPFVVFGAMIMAFTVNVRAALIFVVAIPLLSVVVFGVMVVTRPLYKTVQTRLDRVLGLTRENLTGARVVRAFDKEQTEVNRFEDANALLTKMQLHVGHISALMNPLTYVIINLAIVALLYVGSVQIHVGDMASGDVIALVNYMNQILVELVKLANLIVQVSKALACAGRVQAVLDTKPGMQFPQEVPGEVPAEKQNDAVRFDHVGLTYAGAGAPSLTDISFTAEKGQTIDHDEVVRMFGLYSFTRSHQHIDTGSDQCSDSGDYVFTTSGDEAFYCISRFSDDFGGIVFTIGPHFRGVGNDMGNRNGRVFDSPGCADIVCNLRLEVITFAGCQFEKQVQVQHDFFFLFRCRIGFFNGIS